MPPCPHLWNVTDSFGLIGLLEDSSSSVLLGSLEESIHVTLGQMLAVTCVFIFKMERLASGHPEM